jgi:radical SAM superfamily enzyme YgiQ (UPF0313 family)
MQFIEAFQQTSFDEDKRSINTKGIYNKEKNKDAMNQGIKTWSYYSDKGSPSETSPQLPDLDEIEMPAYDMLDLDFYFQQSPVLNVGAAHVMWNRGCPFKCTFCASHIVHGRNMRFKSISQIVKELRFLVDEKGFTNIQVMDDLFGAKKSLMYELGDELRKNGWSHIKFTPLNALSVAVMDEKLIQCISDMNTNLFTFPIESGSPYVQKHILRKNVPLNKARRLINFTRELSSEHVIEINIILGLHDETPEMMQESIDYMYSVDVDWVNIYIAMPHPGTEMYERFVERGFIEPDLWNMKDLDMYFRDFDTPHYTTDDLTTLVYDLNIYRNFFHNSDMKNKRFDKAINNLNSRVIERYPFHVVAIYTRAIAYIEQGQEDKAIEDFQRCAQLIIGSTSGSGLGNHQDAKHLYLRYGHEMPLLKPYVDTELEPNADIKNNNLVNEQGIINAVQFSKQPAEQAYL